MEYRHFQRLSIVITNNYLEPFKADKRKVMGLAIELDDMGKGLLDWKVVE